MSVAIMSKRKADVRTVGEKRKRISQKFRDEYGEKFPCITNSTLSVHHARCKVCLLDFTVSHGGMGDVLRHVKSVRHCDISSCKAATPSVSNFFGKSNESQNLDQDVIRAEVLFTNFLVEHNIALSASDHAGNLF